MEMVLIPAGAFLMGDDDRSDNPRRTVSLDAYWISRHPVTVKQYRAFCSATGRAFPGAPSWGWNDDHPMVNVSWDDAQAFCAWAGMTLPTEAQWEKAARGTDGRKFPWGDEWDKNKCQCSKKDYGDAGSTAPVGSYPQGASPYGVLDMAGNVRERCEDKYDSGSRFRVLRGGSWYTHLPLNFRCAFLSDLAPDFGINFLGFRCVVRSDTL
jgi:formylglycine-generating enzyme required for sulfatase activity